MTLYVVSYTINGQTVTTRGNTAEGARATMSAVIKAGGWGYSWPYQYEAR